MLEQSTAGLRAVVTDALSRADVTDPRSVWRGLGESGVLRALYRPRLDLTRLAVLLEELDRRCPAGVVLSACVQVATVIPLLGDPGAGAVAARVRQAALRGEAVVALAVTDRDAPGSELLDAATRAELREESVVVTGGKNWITNACHSDYALVLARHRAVRHFTSFCWVLVPATATGVSTLAVGEAWFAGAGLGHLSFNDVEVPRDHLVGTPGRALAGFARQIGTERLAGALWARALCRRVLADTHRWLTSPTPAGGRRWDNTAVRERFARCLVEQARIDALCAAHLDPDEGTRADRPSAAMLLKAAIAQGVEHILGECVHLRGADSFRAGGEAALRAAAAMFGIAGGATGAMLAGIADHAEEVLRG